LRGIGVNSEPFVRKGDIKHRVPDERIAGLISKEAAFMGALSPVR
jgi:hypothetical protein